MDRASYSPRSRLQVIALVIAFAAGYALANAPLFQSERASPTRIEVTNDLEQTVLVTIREQKLYRLGEVEAATSRSRELPNIGLYEVTASDPTGKVVASGMVAPSSEEGVRVLIKDGEIVEISSPHDA